MAFITEFFQTKGKTRIEIAKIVPAELNEPLSEFILSVRHRLEVCQRVLKGNLKEIPIQSGSSMTWEVCP